MKINYLKSRIIELLIFSLTCLIFIIASIFSKLKYNDISANIYSIILVPFMIHLINLIIRIILIKKDCQNKIFTGKIEYISIVNKYLRGSYIYCKIKFIDDNNIEHIYEDDNLLIDFLFIKFRVLDYLIGQSIKFSYSKTNNKKVYIREIKL